MGAMYILGKQNGAPTRFPLYFREKVENVIFHTIVPHTAKTFPTLEEAERFRTDMGLNYFIKPLVLN